MRVLGISVAEAQETCVICSGPTAVYRCTIEKSDKIARFGSMADKAIQTVCIKEMARTGGHEILRRDAAIPPRLSATAFSAKFR